MHSANDECKFMQGPVLWGGSEIGPYKRMTDIIIMHRSALTK